MSLLVIYDAGDDAARRRIESLLQYAGLVRLFRNVRWGRLPEVQYELLLRRLRTRLRHTPHRIAFLRMPANHVTAARWLVWPIRREDDA